MHGQTFFDEYAAQHAASGSNTPGSNQTPVHPQPETVPAAPAETVPNTPAEVVTPEPTAPVQVQTTQEPTSVSDQEGGSTPDGT